MLFDEPTSALDPEPVNEVLRVKSLPSDGTTMMLATHEMRFARRISDCFIFIENGRFVSDEAPEALLSNSNERGTALLRGSHH